MPKPKLTCSYQGRTFSRRTERPYTHVVIVQCDYAMELAKAEARSATEGDRQDFEYQQWKATRTPGVASVYPKSRGTMALDYSAEEIAAAAAQVAAGFEAYVANIRASAIAWVEKRKAGGGYEPGDYRWSQSAALAAKCAASIKLPLRVLAIVEVDQAKGAKP